MNIIVTGKIGSGKSTVADALYHRLKIHFSKFKEKINLIDADKIGHELLQEKFMKDRLVINFGDSIIKGSNVSRKKLGDIVFNDPMKLNELNLIVHPEIRRVIEEKVVNDEINIIDAALFYELELDKIANFVVLVDAGLKESIKRLSGRYVNEVITNIYKNQKIPKEYDFQLNTAGHDIKDSAVQRKIDDMIIAIENRYFMIDKD